MIITNEKVTLDGKTAGIIVETVGNSNKRKYIYSKGKYIRLFKNIAIAKVTAKSIVGNNVPLRFHFSFDGKDFLLDDCQKVKDHWEVIDNGVRYIIYEQNRDQVTRLGYIVFENGDKERCDKSYGITRVSELMGYIRDISGGILGENGQYAINRITKPNRNQEYVLHIKNSTAKIHILTNSRLMDINQARKELDYRCLPFVKEMDKFTTLYVYASKDLAETSRIGSDEIVDKIIEYIIADLQDYHSDSNPKFVPVEFSGYINISEDEYYGKNC